MPSDDQPAIPVCGWTGPAALRVLEDGVAKGFDSDLARELSRVLGREVRLEAIDFRDAQQRILVGDAGRSRPSAITWDGVIDRLVSHG